MEQNIKGRVSFLPIFAFSLFADFFCLSLVCFDSNGVSFKQRVTKIPEKTILLSSIKLKSIFENLSTYNNMYIIKER